MNRHSSLKGRPSDRRSSRTRLRAYLDTESLELRSLLSTANPAPLADLSGIVASPAIESSVQPAATSALPQTAMTPAQIRAAYGFNGVRQDGTGQTIAIIEAFNDPTLSSDLNAFDQQFGLTTSGQSLYNLYGPASNFLTQVSQAGSTTSLPSTDAGWALETAMDVEWAHAIAPGAKILVVEANSANLSDLMAAVNYARNQGAVDVVSMSWGGSEFRSETAYDSYFTTPAGHKGITFVAASGDEGGAPGADWPASSPNVVSVGGTSLTINPSTNAYVSETAWLYSGGGISRYEAEPTYQRAAQSTGARTTPDVAYNADPSTGFAVYDSTAYQGQTGWFQVGGTSAGAPQWAAEIALADQSLATGSLDGAGQTLPILYALGTGSAAPYFFHDVTTGNSIRWLATPRYDGATGLGSPIANVFVQSTTGGTGIVGTTPAASSGHAASSTSRPLDTIATTTTQPPAATTSTSSAQPQPVLFTIVPAVPVTPPTPLPAPAPPVVPNTPLITPVQISAGQSLLIYPSEEESGPPNRAESEPEPIAPAEWTLEPVRSISLPAEEIQEPDLTVPGLPAPSPAFLRLLDSINALYNADDSETPLPAAPEPPAVPAITEEERASTLEAALSAALAVAVWGAWEWRSANSDNRRRWLRDV
jgi:hypothetical protein